MTMKRIIIPALAFIAIALASCDGKQAAKSSEATDTTAISTVDETATEAETQISTEADEIISQMSEQLSKNDKAAFGELSKQAQAKIEKYLAAGDTESARIYSAQLKKFMDENMDKVRAVADADDAVSSLISTVASTSAKEIADGIKDAAKTDAENIASEVKESAKQKIEDAEAKAQNDARNKINEAKAKANEKVNETAGKLLEHINKQ